MMLLNLWISGHSAYTYLLDWTESRCKYEARYVFWDGVNLVMGPNQIQVVLKFSASKGFSKVFNYSFTLALHQNRLQRVCETNTTRYYARPPVGSAGQNPGIRVYQNYLVVLKPIVS